jgi:hypothetical protein
VIVSSASPRAIVTRFRRSGVPGERARAGARGAAAAARAAVRGGGAGGGGGALAQPQLMLQPLNSDAAV